MEQPRDFLSRALDQPVVLRPHGSDWRADVATARQALTALGAAPRRLWVDEPDATRMFAVAATGLAQGHHVFLASPAWTAAEREAAWDAARPEAAWRDGALRGWSADSPASPKGGPRLMIATGGTSGRVRFAVHGLEGLWAAARGFADHFGLERVHSLCVLPAHRIGGFQQLIRAIATGGTVTAAVWPDVVAGERPPIAGGAVLSLVPTQLERLLREPGGPTWLGGFAAIFLGGAAASPGLLDAARRLGLRLAPAYGATETAAQVAALQPEEFLAGAGGCGSCLPHARVRIVDADGHERPPGQRGRVVIEGASLFRGYWPDDAPRAAWTSGDEGWLDAHGRLHLAGRADDVIITGGEKVDPLEVEAALRANGRFGEVAVVGVPDERWGEVVTAVFPADDRPDLAAVEQQLRTLLPPHKLPRRWVPVAVWPALEAGKVNRAALRRLAAGG